MIICDYIFIIYYYIMYYSYIVLLFAAACDIDECIYLQHHSRIEVGLFQVFRYVKCLPQSLPVQ